MNLNPLTILDALLADYLSEKARRVIHGVILLIAAIVAIWLGVEGNWKEFAVAVVTAIYAAANKANTPAISDAEFEALHAGDEPETVYVDETPYDAGDQPLFEDGSR